MRSPLWTGATTLRGGAGRDVESELDQRCGERPLMAMATFPNLKTDAVAQYPAAAARAIPEPDAALRGWQRAAIPRLRVARCTGVGDPAEPAGRKRDWRRWRSSFWPARERSGASRSRTHGTGRYTRTAAWRAMTLTLLTTGEMRGSTTAHVVENRAERMPVYPQLESGAMSQFPVGKTAGADGGESSGRRQQRSSWRTRQGEVTEWQSALRGSERRGVGRAGGILCRGGGHAERIHVPGSGGESAGVERRLERSGVAARSALSLTGSVSDPLGGTLAWRLTNGGGADRALAQTLEAPGAYLYCLSAYVRAATASSGRADDRQPGDAAGGDQRVDADRAGRRTETRKRRRYVRDADPCGRRGGRVRASGGGAGRGVRIQSERRGRCLRRRAAGRRRA